MGKNVIVSEETLRDLLEAHASLSAWYYELWAGLRAVNATARTPDDAARAAFVERLAAEFPDIAHVARSIRVPRMYVPAPPPYLMQAAAAPPPRGTDEPATIAEPAPTRAKPCPEADAPAEAATDSSKIAPPPLVVPSAVKY
jgi:hypothetical protein